MAESCPPDQVSISTPPLAAVRYGPQASHPSTPSDTTLVGSKRSITSSSSSSSTEVEKKDNPHAPEHKQPFQSQFAIQPDLESQSVSRRKRFSSFRYAILDIYRRLFTLVFCANVAVFIYVMTATERKLLGFVNAAAANLLVCGLARQPLVVNAMFMSLCWMPRTWPIRLRRLAAKVYHYGGVHSGCGVAALVWYLGFVGLMSWEFWSSPMSSSSSSSTSDGKTQFTVVPVVLAYIILGLLLTMVVVAYPAFRFKRHDYFELTHRFSAWTVIALFVALLLIFSRELSHPTQPLGQFLIRFPAFWFLVITVLAIIHPWLLLRRVKVEPEDLSNHAVRLRFDYTSTTFGKGTQLAIHPLRDWHGFATFPNIDPRQAQAGLDSRSQRQGYSCLISKAGDWTSSIIQNPPTHLWKRGILTYGFAYSMRLFSRVIIVTTGSGIGPCLSFLGFEQSESESTGGGTSGRGNSRSRRMTVSRPALRVVWQTRSPLKTYGPRVLDLVRTLDPNPVVIDTDQAGRRVDMVPLVRRMCREWDAEAVCVISNPGLTRKVVLELEAEGIFAYGPIFDS